ncbi:Hypothetical predicted protein [Paramuricea clavata]|uniref:FP protein C-terminal domain-containing protein n=1 Tax=Paramuricea clavata TaxID=317549 RepID=A0A6S7JRL1_PARCT|nr:Hypothetical predicted protein [Paramuricea clavata]
MVATKQLRKENEELREEITQLKEKLDEISLGLKVASQKGTTTLDQTKSIEFLSNQHDDFVKFTTTAMKDIREITTRLDKIEKKCDSITQAVDDIESYSYRYNIKIHGVPMTAENESTSQLDLPGSAPLNRLSIYDHLTPKQQNLFYEAKKYREVKQYKYCWVKQGVLLRKNDSSTVIKLNKLEDLTSLQ